MKRFLFLSNVLVSLGCVWLLTVGCSVEAAQAAQPGAKKTPKPKPPHCQQDDKERDISDRFLFSGKENHYVHVLLDPTDERYARVLTDGVLVDTQFDAGKVGPVVYNPSGDRFAFIATRNGKKYVLEYANGARTPFIAEPIEDAWNDWVCYGTSGKHLVTLARHDKQWDLMVRDTSRGTTFTRYPLIGKPTRLELVPERAGGKEGFTYASEGTPAQMEITIWFDQANQ